MTRMNSDNLAMKFEDDTAFLTVSGPASDAELQESVDALGEFTESNDNVNLCVDMAKTDFDDLGAVSKGLRSVGYVLRRAHDIEKCAVMSDSGFVRSSAKVEGAVIPGMEIESFGLDEINPALNWLDPARNKPEPNPDAVIAAATPEAPSANKWDNLKLAKVDY